MIDRCHPRSNGTACRPRGTPRQSVLGQLYRGGSQRCEVGWGRKAGGFQRGRGRGSALRRGRGGAVRGQAREDGGGDGEYSPSISHVGPIGRIEGARRALGPRKPRSLVGTCRV